MNPNITRALIGGVREIEPTIPVGGLVFQRSLTRTYPGNGNAVLACFDEWTVPDNWAKKTYRYMGQVSSSASYTCVGFQIIVYVNGVQHVLASTPASNTGYYRYNSGTLTYYFDMEIKAGDVVTAYIYMTGRNVGGSTPSSYSYHELKRIT